MNDQPLKSFDYPQDIINDFIYGDCWLLAMALNARTGLPYAAIWGASAVNHIGLELPSGLVVDIEGIWEKEPWTNRWIRELEFLDDVHQAPVSAEHREYRALLTSHTPAGENHIYGGKTLRVIANEVMEHLKEMSLPGTIWNPGIPKLASA